MSFILNTYANFTLSNLEFNNSHNNNWSFIIIAFIWTLNLIVYFQFWKFIQVDKKFEKINDPPTLKYLHYVYLFRITFASFPESYTIDINNILIDFVDTNYKKIFQISIPFFWFAKNCKIIQEKIETQNQALIFHFNRNTPFPNFHALRIIHDSKVSGKIIKFHEMNIRQPFSPFHLTFLMSSPIKSITDGLKAMDQVFFKLEKNVDNFISEIEPLTKREYVLFNLFFTNFSAIFSLVIPTSVENSTSVFENIFYGLVPFLISSLLTIGFAALYKTIKILSSPYKKLNFYFIKDLFLIGFNLISLFLGAMAATFATELLPHQIFNWGVRMISSQVSLFFILVLFYFLYNLLTNKYYILPIKTAKIEIKPPSTVLKSISKTPQRSASTISVQSTGSSYYDQLMAEGNIPQVKSISQYGNLLKV